MAASLLAGAMMCMVAPGSVLSNHPPAPDSTFARADRLLRQGAPDSVLALVEPLVTRAAADGDTAVELVGRLHQAGALALSGRVREAEQIARQARGLADRMGEPARARMASRWLGYALLGQGRGAEALDIYRQLLVESVAAGDLREEGYARLGLAYLALGRGETVAAREDYERSALLFHKTGETAMELDALVGLARTLGRDGKYNEMKLLYERILQEGERAGVRRAVGFALNNLGSYEYQAGDPGRAVGYWERILRDQLLGDEQTVAVTPGLNLALAQMELGAFDDATAALQDLIARCRTGGYREHEARVLAQLAAVELARGNATGARSSWRRIMEMTDVGQETRLSAALQLASSLLRGGQPASALTVCDSVTTGLVNVVAVQQRTDFDVIRAGAFALLGRHSEAVTVGARAARAARVAGFRRTEIEALVQLAGSERALGAPGNALSHLRTAQKIWDELRSLPRDPQWREQRGSLASTIHLDLAAVLLEHPTETPAADRVRAAFDALQEYKARTLEERMFGPDTTVRAPAAPKTPVTLERLQSAVLRPNEVLLDIYVGEDQSLMFAVTKTSCRAVPLPSGRALQGLVRLFVELVSTPPASGPDVDAVGYGPAARRLSREFLMPVAAELKSNARIMIAADGMLNRLPFELLPLDPSGDDPTALGAGREVTRVPSAAVLMRLRGHDRVHKAAAAPHGIVVFGDGDAALPGVAKEVKMLRRGYREAEVVNPGCGAGDGTWASAVAGRSILHIPAHSEAFDQRPWNSRISLGDAGDGTRCWLLSSEIAGTKLEFDLVVLSGCSSAGGRVLSGEGMLGLSGAFLAAGSRAVVASLWDVDDAATASFMASFYRELAGGRTVAGALSGARQALSQTEATSAPCYWAGFVVVGDGDLLVPLQKRTGVSAARIGFFVAAGMLLGGFIGLRGRKIRRPVIFRRGGPLS